LLIAHCSLLFALDGFYFGLGSEINGNSHTGMASCVFFSFGLDVSSDFSIGTKASYHHDMNLVTTLEPRLLFRYTLSTDTIRPFVQAETGAVIVSIDSDTYYMFSAGLTTGCRIAMTNRFYLEPALRIGYPFLWGAGVTIGLQIQMRNEQ
jgi:hypothetical protein